MSPMKEAYLYMIGKAAEECNDISTLDLVWRILVKCGGADGSEDTVNNGGADE